MKTKLTLRASIRAYGRLREKGECCNLGVACRTYQGLRFLVADESLPVLEFSTRENREKEARAKDVTIEKSYKNLIARQFVNIVFLSCSDSWWTIPLLLITKPCCGFSMVKPLNQSD